MTGTEPHVRRSLPSDPELLAPKLRDVDAKECREIGGIDPIDALTNGTKHPCRTIVGRDGAPIAMFGVAPLGLPGIGIPWLLCADAMVDDAEIREKFRRLSPLWLVWMESHYPVLFNLVLRENLVARKWLRSLGFEFQEAPLPGALLFRKMPANV